MEVNSTAGTRYFDCGQSIVSPERDAWATSARVFRLTAAASEIARNSEGLFRVAAASAPLLIAPQFAAASGFAMMFYNYSGSAAAIEAGKFAFCLAPIFGNFIDIAEGANCLFFGSDERLLSGVKMERWEAWLSIGIGIGGLLLDLTCVGYYARVGGKSVVRGIGKEWCRVLNPLSGAMTARALKSQSSWKIDATHFVNPKLGEALPMIVRNPGRAAPGVAIDTATQAKIIDLTARYSLKVRDWQRDVGHPITEDQRWAIMQPVRERLEASVRLGFRTLPDEIDDFFGHFPLQSRPHPRLAGPVEYALNQFDGMLYGYARWGIWSYPPQTFMQRVTATSVRSEMRLPTSAYRQNLGDGFFIDRVPGVADAYGGVDMRLVWHGEHSGLENPVTLMEIGYIGNSRGFDIVKVYGLKVGRIKVAVDSEGGKESLYQLAQRRFGSRLDEWLTRQCIRGLLAEDPSAVIRLQKEDWKAFRYRHVPNLEHTDQEGNLYSLSKTLLDLSEADRRRLTREGIAILEGRVAELEARRVAGSMTPAEAVISRELKRVLAEARRGIRQVGRINAMAVRLGFIRQGPNSPYYVLHWDCGRRQP